MDAAKNIVNMTALAALALSSSAGLAEEVGPMGSDSFRRSI